eukprot:5531699-Pyramimonas_sp.AAC.1
MSALAEAERESVEAGGRSTLQGRLYKRKLAEAKSHGNLRKQDLTDQQTGGGGSLLFVLLRLNSLDWSPFCFCFRTATHPIISHSCSGPSDCPYGGSKTPTPID